MFKTNKKAFLADNLVLVICFVAFFIIGFIFYILFGIAGKLSVYEIGSDSRSASANYALLNYLRTPVEINGNQMNIADLIVLSINNDNYNDLIKNTKEIVGKENAYYSILIYDKAKYDAVEKGEKTYWTPSSAGLKAQMHSSDDIVSDDQSWAEVVIPNLNEEIPAIMISFMYGTGRELAEEEKTLQDFGQYGSI